MKHNLVLALILAATSTASFAHSTHTTTSYPTSSSSSVSSASGGSSTAYGGTGGTAAVLGSGNSSAQGGSVNRSGNSSNYNANDQLQKQSQSSVNQQAQQANNHQTQSATGGAGGAGGTGVGSQGQSTNVDDHSVYEATQRAAATAFATPLTSSNDTCMGSSSGAMQGPGFGLSVGSTWTDKNCIMLKNSRELWNMGLKEAAMARMCMDKDNREAIELSGLTCPTRKVSEGSSTVNASEGSSASSRSALREIE